MHETTRTYRAIGLRPARGLLRTSRARPEQVALLWLIHAMLCIVEAVLFPGSWVSSVIFLSGTPIFAGLLAGWALRLRAGTLVVIAMLCIIAIVLQAIWLAWEIWAALRSGPMPDWWSFNAAAAIAITILIWRSHATRGKLRRIAAIALVLLANLAAIAFTQTDELFWNASQRAQYLLNASVPEARAETPDPMGGITLDRLWEAQGDLIAKEVGALQPRVPGQTNIYAITVAAGGGQQLFAREAQLALKVAAERFGPAYRGGILLSNGAVDLLRHPLASRTNFAAAAHGVGTQAGRTDDIAFIYLAAHGSGEAFLATDLPNLEQLTPVSSASVARALGQAGIRRRVIVVSACFAASWIPSLANDDTIVIAAAAKDRTSFGCDDRRELTYFGEAFLKGPLARGASLHDAFQEARRKIASWEKAEKLDPSKPQAYVGKNMREFWNAGKRAVKPT